MGADLLLCSYPLPEGREPNFSECRAALQAFTEEQRQGARYILEELGLLHEEDDDSKIQDIGEQAIREVETAYGEYHRFAAILECGHGHRILVAGGPSWGDEPYDGYNVFCAFGELGFQTYW